MRVLVVEDNLVGQRLIYYILLQWHVSTDLAANGKIALDLLSKDVYDVILMDLMMPELDGYDATKEIRSWEGSYYKNVPIFAFSASPDLGRIKDCGMNGLISKTPIIKEELYQKISPYWK